MVLSSTWCFFLLVWLSVCFCLFVFLFVCLFVSGWNSALNFFVSFIHYWNKWYKIKKTKTFSFQKQYNIRKSTLIIWERFLFYYVDQIFFIIIFFYSCIDGSQELTCFFSLLREIFPIFPDSKASLQKVSDFFCQV